jgi:hypothetical protein
MPHTMRILSTGALVKVIDDINSETGYITKKIQKFRDRRQENRASAGLTYMYHTFYALYVKKIALMAQWYLLE